ncbi:hypothetical protein RJ639_014396 [Escallonia herrerae]|uniref:Chromo domain-containing protein n=1 Tax=Escallonia herrerae TaxID=1293975 RepID=A0AA88VGX0_9ASTE|nr:hypothetical protein RJ639_014396 [Escallonia herrerae]
MPLKKKGNVPRKGLMYVDIKVNGKAIRAMVDTGVTHNYISGTKVERLGLTLEKGCGHVTAINSAAQPVARIARFVLIKGLEALPIRLELRSAGRQHCSEPLLSQSKLTPKKAKWQELLAELTFLLEYMAGSTNSVADAFSRKVEVDQLALIDMNAIIRAESRVAINIRKKIKKALTKESVAQQLLKLVKSASCKCHQEYLVKWQGYTKEENTWGRAVELSAYNDKIEVYHMQKFTRASTAPVEENHSAHAPTQHSTSKPIQHSTYAPAEHSASAPIQHGAHVPCLPSTTPIRPPNIVLASLSSPALMLPSSIVVAMHTEHFRRSYKEMAQSRTSSKRLNRSLLSFIS